VAHNPAFIANCTAAANSAMPPTMGSRVMDRKAMGTSYLSDAPLMAATCAWQRMEHER